MMLHSFKHLFGLLIVTMTLSFSSHSTQATTVSEMLNNLRQKQLSIQDYDFLVSRSFLWEAVEKNQAGDIAQNMYDKLFNQVPPPSAEEIDRRAMLIEFNREKLAKNNFTGAIFEAKGIGSTIRSYAISTVGDPQTDQMVKFVNASPEEQDNLEELYEIQKPKLIFGQHRLDLSKVIINGLPPSEITRRPGEPIIRSYVNMDSDNLFEFPTQSKVWIEDGGSQKVYRSDNFPFWHEEALQYATEDNTTIVKESEDEIELHITADNTPRNFSFTLYCSPEGRVRRYIKKSNGETQLVADYMNFVAMGEGIEIPQMGSMWMPASGDTTYPMQDWTRVSTILNGSINLGLTLDDFYIEVPEGTSILDQRSTRATPDDGETRLTTTQTVRLGADIPNDIRILNQQDDTANSE